MDAIDFLRSLESQANSLGIRMADICRKAGMQQSLVSRWKAGVHEPRLSKLNQLRDAFEALMAERAASSLEDLL